MFSGVTLLTDIDLWARGRGLEIVLLITGAILLTRLAAWLGAKITDRIDANAQETDALVRSEAAKHRHALAQVITWTTLVVIYCATAVAIAARLGIPVTNLSRGWARAVMDVPVPAAVDVNRVSDLLRQIGAEAYEEPELRELLLDPPAVMGVQSIDVGHFQVRMVARTLPGKQFDVGRMLRARIAAGLRREGIHLPTGLDTAEPTGSG